MTSNGFTPTERAILKVLEDGKPHPRDELRACLPDKLGNFQNVNVHVTNLRRKLRPRGHNVVCLLIQRRIHYQHVMLLHTQS
jgi:DNA-binding response OmpR family regulator